MCENHTRKDGLQPDGSFIMGCEVFGPGCVVCGKECPESGYRKMYCSTACIKLNWPEYNEVTGEHGRSFWQIEQDKK